MTKRSIHAVLAGINDYAAPVTPLRGCIKDVGVWEEYLKKQKPDFEVNLVVLKNAEVTKSALSDALRESLTKSKKGDVVFFFYSGHGTREAADPVFSELEQDKALESLVCFDSIKYKGSDVEYHLLCDKELHYLISAHSKEGVHILTIFDCCHSGGITRNMFLSEKDGVTIERRYVPADRMSFVAPKRRWEKFLFADTVSHAKVEAQGWLAAVPQKRHITISACQNDESAFEQNGRGIFTENMLEVLKRSGGALSYYDLQSRVRLFTQNQFRQTPEVYAVRGHEDDLLRTFLDKAIVHKDFGCTCYYKKDVGWVIDLGAIHGLSAYSGPIEIIEGNDRHTVSIDQVLSHYTRLKIPKDIGKQLKEAQAYGASVKSHFSGNTAFYLDPKGDDKGVLLKLSKQADAFISENKSPFTVTESLANAGYVIRIDERKIRICINDDGRRPVTEVALSDVDELKKTLQYMRHIAQWEYIRTLCNPDFVAGRDYPVEFKIYRIPDDNSRKELSLKGDTLEFDYETDEAGLSSGKIKVQITNKSTVKYYCAILYLSNEFQVYGNMLDGKVIGLNPNESAWIHNGDVIDLDLEQHVVDFNYAHSIFYLKLLANPEPFQVDVLEQSALPAPVKSIRRGHDEATSKGVKTREDKAVKKVQWFTRTLCFKGRNPQFKEKQ